MNAKKKTGVFRIAVISTCLVMMVFCYALGRRSRSIEDIEIGRQIAFSQIKTALKDNISGPRVFFVADLQMKGYPLGNNTIRLKFEPAAQEELTHPVLALAQEAAQ